ncbi:MAG: minor capsid protein [Lachnospiraceae bacterium]|nr:minor capsid protein [Lachnospiraceae bacterium]
MANRSLSSEEYWRQREATAREQAISRADGYASDIKDIYTRMLSNTQTQINDFYTKYATSEGITMAEARKKVSKLDIAAYEAKAKKYVQMARDGSAEAFSERANEEMKLYNLTMKVNRLEMLKSQIGLELVAGNAELEKYFGDTLNSEALAEYRRQSGILGESVIAPASRAKEIVSGSFQSATYSERIWSHQDALKTEIGQKLQQAIISGRGARSVATEISKIFGTSQYNAERLMRTEIRRIQTEVAKDVMEQNGNEEYEYMALGPKPCPICSDLSGQIFKVKSMVPGKNAPPMHPMCMCATAPYWDEAKYQAWLNSGTAEEGVSYDGFRQEERKENINSNSINSSRNISSNRSLGKNVRFRTGEQNEKEWVESKRLALSQSSEEKYKILQERLSSGAYKNKIRKQMQNQHIVGTLERSRRIENDSKTGRYSSYFLENINVDDLIFNTKEIGIITISDQIICRYVSIDDVAGMVYNEGKKQYVASRRLKIEYTAKGIHAYPVKDW